MVASIAGHSGFRLFLDFGNRLGYATLVREGRGFAVSSFLLLYGVAFTPSSGLFAIPVTPVDYCLLLKYLPYLSA